jgi:putative phosphoesterase
MPASSGEIVVGLISDTHGLLRPEALAALAGSHHIVHAGDIGDTAILDELERIGPVTAVRGNNDQGPGWRRVPETEVLDAGGVLIYVIHDLGELALDPAAAGFRVVVSGHSHQPAQREKDGVLYVNPGSAGPRRFSLPVSAGRLCIHAGKVQAELLILPVSSAKNKSPSAARRRKG